MIWLPPLAFLDHVIEKLRNFLHREKYLVDVVNDDWFYGKMQMSLGINNTKDNSVLISITQDNVAEVIDPELNFVSRPLVVTTMSLDVINESQKEFLATKILGAQENGSGWTLHSVSHLTAMLMINPRNVSAIGMLFL